MSQRCSWARLGQVRARSGSIRVSQAAQFAAEVERLHAQQARDNGTGNGEHGGAGSGEAA